MNGWDFNAWVQLHIVEKRKNLNTIPAGAQSFQHWGAMVGFKQGNNVLNQTGGNHLDNMYGMDSKKRVRSPNENVWLHPAWSALPHCGGRWGLECPGRENRLQVWKGMKGFHGNLCLPVEDVALQILQAPFPRTLKSDVRKTEPL